jgi:hypothetical protein
MRGSSEVGRHFLRNLLIGGALSRLNDYPMSGL